MENRVIFKVVYPSGTDIFQFAAAKFSQPAFNRLRSQVSDCTIEGFKKSNGRVGVVLPDILKITVSIQLSIMPDENGYWPHAAMSRLPLRFAKAAKCPFLYGFKGLSRECLSAASIWGSLSSCSTSS